MPITLDDINREREIYTTQLGNLRVAYMDYLYSYSMQQICGVAAPVIKPAAGAFMNAAVFDANPATLAMRQFVRGVYEAASNASEMTDGSKNQLSRDLDFMDANMQLNAALHTLNQIHQNGAQGLSPEGGVFLAKAVKFFNEYSRENPSEEDVVIAFGEFNSSLAELNNQGTAKEIFDIVTDAVKINKGIDDSRQNFNQIQEEAAQRFEEFDRAMRDTEHKIAIIDDKLFHATGGAQGARFNGEPSPNVFTRIGELAERIGAGLARVRANITP